MFADVCKRVVNKRFVKIKIVAAHSAVLSDNPVRVNAGDVELIMHHASWHDKLAKFNKYFGEEGTFSIKIRPERDDRHDVKKVEITLKLQNRIYRAEAKDEEILTAVDRTVDKLESQIRRQRTRIEKQVHDYSFMKEYLSDVEAVGDEEEYEEKAIIKRKSFALVPMTPDDAVLQMEMLGHSFLVYLDAESGTVCVVYKRKDGNYGLIEPTY